MPARKTPRSALHDEALPIPDQHHEGDPRGGGGGESPAHAACRTHPAPGGGPLQLAADGPARVAEGRAHHPRGDEPRRCARAGDAGGTTRGAVAGVGPLARVRAGAAAPEGPPRARLRARAHPRGGDHRHRAPRSAELPPAAGQLLPDPDQVPRRGAPALRRHARARIHHEGRLLLSHRPGLASGRLPCDVRRLHAHLHPHRPHLSRRARRLRRHRWRRLAGISRARRLGRGCHRLLRWRRLRRQSRSRRGAAAARAAPLTARATAPGRHPGRAHHRGSGALSRGAERALREDSHRRGRGRGRRGGTRAARRSRAERGEGAETGGCGEPAHRWPARRASSRRPARSPAP